LPQAYKEVFNRGWANLPQFAWLKEKPIKKKRLEGAETRLKEYCLSSWFTHRMGGYDGMLGFSVREYEDRLEMDWDPCTSGGVRFRGDIIDGTPSRLGEPYKLGVTQESHSWSFGQTGVNLYCCHCCIVHEQREVDYRGYLNWVTKPPTADNPSRPCTWIFYKEQDDIPEEYYTRVGKTKPKRTSKIAKYKDVTKILKVIRSEEYTPLHYHSLNKAIDEGNKEEAIKALDVLAERTKYLHTIYNVWFWAFMDYVADTYGYNELYHALRSVDYSFNPPPPPGSSVPTKETIPSAEKRVRKAALWGRSDRSGPNNEGSVHVIDEGDKFVMELDPCGSGQTMVLKDPFLPGPAMKPPLNYAATKEAHPVSWGKKGIALFCTRCCVQEEMGQIARTGGYLTTIIERDVDYTKPCRWLFYKELDEIPEKYYKRIGAKKPGRQSQPKY
jgi:hypothetical protein